MKNIKKILEDKYKTYDLLTANIFLIALYVLLICLMWDDSDLFFSGGGVSVLFILSAFFFFVSLCMLFYLSALNRGICSYEPVIKNIRRINIIQLGIIYMRIFFLIAMVPLVLALVAIFLMDKLSEHSHTIITISACLLSTCSIIFGIYFYLRKRKVIKIYISVW